MSFLYYSVRAGIQRGLTIPSIKHLLIVLLSFTLLMSCTAARQTVALDEAKDISVKFSGASFVPPPRSINDLRTIIGFYSSEQAMGTCYSEPLEPLEEISERLRNAPPYPHRRSKTKRLERMAWFELNRGNYSRSIKLQKMAIEALPDWPAARGYRYTDLTRFYAQVGDFDSANRALRRASSLFAQTNYRDAWIYYGLNHARFSVERLRGNHTRAEQHCEKAIAASKKLNKPWHVITLKTELAENLLLQGRLLEAEIIARELVTHPRFATGDAFRDGKILLVLGRILFEQGRYSEAEEVARTAINAFLSTHPQCSSVFLNLSRQMVARSLMAQERWEEALAQFDAIREDMKDDPETFKTRFAGDVDWALTLLALRRMDEAAAMFEFSLETSRNLLGQKNYRTAEIRGLLAVTLAVRGDRRRALEEFKASLPILLSQYHAADDEARTRAAKDKRLVTILESYMALLNDIRGTTIEANAGIDAVGEVFRLAEVAHSRSVNRALGASGSRVAMKDPELSDLARREQDLQKQINALYGTLANAMAQRLADRDPKVIESLRTKINKLSAAREALVKEIEDRFPSYAELINPKPQELEKVRASLLFDEALVSIYIGRERSFIWAIPYKGPVAFASVPLGEKDVGEMVARVRSTVEPNVTLLGDIPRFDLDTAYALFESFLEPVKEGWQEAKILFGVPHGPLGYLPLTVLPVEPFKLPAEKKPLFSNYREVPWLIRTHAVTNLPSVASLVTLRSLPPTDPGRLAFVGFADPIFDLKQLTENDTEKVAPGVIVASRGGRLHVRGIRVTELGNLDSEIINSSQLDLLNRLPETAEEIESIARALGADPARDVFLGKHASELQVKSMDLSNRRVIAFATHGLVPGDLDGLLQPALALSSPSVTGDNEDGLLTMGEILKLRLNADWVVLSACNTGAAKGAGAEAVSGLGRAFFYAGARALLVSNWSVETTSAKTLTTDLFRRQKEDPSLDRAEALRQAMLHLIDEAGYVDTATGKLICSYAHPIFWAPFTVVGDRINTTP
jgi:CHAT domain-containing protein